MNEAGFLHAILLHAMVAIVHFSLRRALPSWSTRLGVWLLALALPLMGQGSAPGSSVSLFQRTRPSILDCGLESSVGRTSVHALMLDSHGRLWAGTQNGVAYLGGDGWTAFPLPSEAPSRFVRALLESRDGALWFGTDDGGIWRLKLGQWTHFASGRELPVPRINCLVELPDAAGSPQILAGTFGGGLLSFDGQQWHPCSLPRECQERTIWNLRVLAAPSGTPTVWAVGDNGLYWLEKGNWRFLPKPPTLRATNVNDVALLPDEQGRPWIWASFWGKGLGRWNGERWDLSDSREGFSSAFPTCLAVSEQPNGRKVLWAGTYDGGLLLWTGRRWQRLDTAAELPNQSIYTLQPNPGQVPDLWVGGRGGSLISVNLHGWRALVAGPSFPHLFATCLLETPPMPDGSTFWIGSNEGVLRWNGRSLVREGAETGLPSAYVVDLKATRGPQGPELWAGTLGGIARRVGSRWQALGKTEGLPEVRVNTMLPGQDSRGKAALWIGFEGWLCRWENQQWSVVGKEQGLPRPSIYSLAETHEGSGERSLWVGFRSGGVYRFHGNRWSSFGQERGLPEATVNSLVVVRSPNGHRWLWAGTLGRGVGRLDLDNPSAQWQMVGTAQVPQWPNDVVYRLEFDGTKSLYATTGWGVVRVDLDGPEAAPKAFRAYTVGDGLPSSAGVPGASTVDQEGRIWVGTAKGAAVMDPRGASDPRPAQGPILESLELDDHAVSPVGLTLNHRSHRLRAAFQLLAYHRREDIRFRTQLLGRDPEPGEWTREARRELAGLGAGEFVLRVWARDALGGIYGPLDLPITVKPAPWRRGWAYGIYALLLGGSVIWIVRLRSRQSLIRQRHLENLVAVRTRELNEQAETLRRINRELEQSTAEVRANQVRLKAIFDNAGIGIGLVDHHGRYIQFNDHWADMLGYSREELLGLTNLDITHPDDQVASAESLQSLLRGEIPSYHLEKRFLRKDGSVFWGDLSATAIQGPDGRVEALIGMISDITDKKESMDLLMEAKRQAEEATRAKSEFLANMSHEIRTPMNAIMGLCHLALRTELTPKQQGYLTRVLASSRLLLRILNDILDISKIEAGRLEIEQVDFNLGHVLHHVQDLLSVRTEDKGLELRISVAGEVPSLLRGDPLRLGQVLLNLLSNAEKFTEKGFVALDVSLVRREAHRAVLCFAVSDSGIGMTTETLSRLFQPFSQADASTTRRFGGSGLGLAISRRLAEMMDGSLEAESVPGQGSTFRFAVPMELQTAPESLEPPPPLEPLAAARPGAHLLVVEDNATNRLITGEMLMARGFRVTMATQGQEAVDRVLAGTETFDLILMDVQMPVMDGLEATARLRRAGVTTPILALTAHAMASEHQRCLQAGMNDHLSKPFEPRELDAALERWLIETPGPSDPTGPDPQPELPFDFEGLRSQLSGNAAKASLLVAALIEDLTTNGAALQIALDTDDADRARTAAHSLKGIGNLLGPSEIPRLAIGAEQAIREGRPWQEAVRILKRHLDALVNRLKAASLASVAPPALSAPAKEELRQTLDRLEGRLQRHSLQARKDLARLQEVLGDDPRLHTLQTCLDRLDFQGAAQCLPQLRETLSSSNQPS